MQCAGVVAWALGASAERERRVLVVERVSVRKSRLVLTLHIILFHISLTEPLWIAATFRAPGQHQNGCSNHNVFCEQVSHGDRSSIGSGHRQAGLSEAIASAQRLPLTMALSRLGGHPVSVQLPASSKFAIGLRWIGRCNLLPGLSDSVASEIVR